MQVDLNKVFPLEASPELAWQFLQDVESVAGCMPGAEITDKVDANHYKGKVRVKLGPVTAAFNGDVVVKGIDGDKRELKLMGKGTDSKGTSNAKMDLTANIRNNGQGKAELVGEAAVIVNGKLANFGGRMMTQVADQILNEFAANFAANLRADQPAGASTQSSASEADANTSQHSSGELHGLKFVWNVLVGFIKSFFKR